MLPAASFLSELLPPNIWLVISHANPIRFQETMVLYYCCEPEILSIIISILLTHCFYTKVQTAETTYSTGDW